MKKVMYLLIAISAFSCGDKAPIQKTERTPLKLEKHIGEILLAHRGFDTNDLIARDLITDVESKISDSLMLSGIYTDLPLKVLSMKPAPTGKGAIVVMYADNFDYGDEINFAKITTFDIIALVPDSLAKKINDKKSYLISPKSTTRVNQDQLSALVRQVYYGSDVEIGKNEIGGQVKINLGSFICEIDGITEYVK